MKGWNEAKPDVPPPRMLASTALLAAAAQKRPLLLRVMARILPDSVQNDRILSWRSENFVIAALLAITVEAVFSSVYRALSDSRDAWICLAGSLWSIGSLLYFRWAGRLAIARESLTICGFLVLCALSLDLGGIAAPTVLWLSICPMLGIVIGGTRPGMIWLGIVLTASAAIYAMDITGVGITAPVVTDMRLLYLLSTLGLIATVALFLRLLEQTNASAFHALNQALQLNRELAVRDDLTRLFNRRHIISLIEAEKSRADRERSSFCVCLMDLDHFKLINDNLGHAAGDAVLQRFAELVEGLKRGHDQFGRVGGEEFLLLLPRADEAAAFQVAERIRREAAKNSHSIQGHDAATVSIGVAQYLGTETVAHLISRADAALYTAKRTGRNRTLGASSIVE